MENKHLNFVMSHFINLPVKEPYFLSREIESMNKDNILVNSDSEKKSKNKIEDLCPICYDTIKDKCYVEDCLHKFCFKCINIWIKRKRECPVCRTKIKKIKEFNKVPIIIDKSRTFKINLYKKK